MAAWGYQVREGGGLTTDDLFTLRALTMLYPPPGTDPAAVGRALDELGNLQRRLDRAQPVLDELAALCPCQPAGPSADGPLRECIVHGETDAVVADLIAARDFRDQVFDLDAWDRGRRWAYDTVAGRSAPLPDAAADPQERHYRQRIRSSAEMLSRMMGRLVGYQQARDELAELAREGRARWTGRKATG